MSSETIQRPTLEQVENELDRRNRKKRYARALTSTIWTLVVVAAVSVIFANFFLSVLRIQGTSMVPTLEDGEIVVALRTSRFERGDITAFYFNNKVLLKRVIGMPGDWVNIDEDGNVYINDVLLDEPYLPAKALGEHDITFPYQVPESRFFVLGDHRDISLDSRSNVIGAIAEEQIIGKVVFRVWPLQKLGSTQ